MDIALIVGLTVAGVIALMIIGLLIGIVCKLSQHGVIEPQSAYVSRKLIFYILHIIYCTSIRYNRSLSIEWQYVLHCALYYMSSRTLNIAIRYGRRPEQQVKNGGRAVFAARGGSPRSPWVTSSSQPSTAATDSSASILSQSVGSTVSLLGSRSHSSSHSHNHSAATSSDRRHDLNAHETDAGRRSLHLHSRGFTQLQKGAPLLRQHLESLNI